MTSSQVTVAAFDVDGTLTRRDCVVPFLRVLGGRRGIVAALVRSPTRVARAVVRRDRDLMKAVVVGGVYRGRPVTEVVRSGEQFAEVIQTTLLRPDTLARLVWHQAQGHQVVIVSASLRSYLAPLATMLGITHVLCTDVASSGGVYLGALSGGNCRGAEKAHRLAALSQTEGWHDAIVWAYGDSAGDREMLAMAHHPVLVRGTTVTAVPIGEQR